MCWCLQTGEEEIGGPVFLPTNPTKIPCGAHAQARTHLARLPSESAEVLAKDTQTTGPAPPDTEDEGAAPVTILDGTGRVIRIVPAAEFRRIHGVPERPTIENLRRTRGRARTRPLEPA
jgi:hypothetical protein